MEKLILEQKDAVDWVYRGEGAANLVLAYTGSSPAFIGKVMRIQKSQRNGKNEVKGNGALTKHEQLVWQENEVLMASPNNEIVDHLYVKHVMCPLLGPKNVDAGLRVLVAKEFLEFVDKNVTCHRPAWRVDSSQVDMNRDSVLIMSDHSIFPNGTLKGGPCITVEIKPKCGFLPISRFIAEENAVKRTITRFKMHQALKLHNQEISEYSEYNPLDLFSGSRDRICKAIEALYATPQNNFRVFLNGSLVFGGLGSGTDCSTILVGEAFENALKNVIQADNGLRTTSFIQLVAETVYTSGVLDQLLEVQKLDAYDIEGAIHAYYNIISQPCMVCRELSKDKLSHLYTPLHSIPLDESLKIVKGYLIAASAKDCSLMISFRPKENDDLLSRTSYSTVYLGSTNQVFEYKVHFIDLDLKPLKKMEYYYELDKKIVNCYSQTVKTEREADNAVNGRPWKSIEMKDMP
ncbi:inositol-pentakisphosphate 2-kinase-like isoform X2 [Durio zibethinus]|uniref:Inositol-pentakisphosphate 2-kinase n=1 Tax=Durio zibethinus TaxID=66656 RepID=A0A6P6AEF9_DURZI|nr:inositol-pentakisphosphate 2-kinase-like isoform X2 [Durio zibethinus]